MILRPAPISTRQFSYDRKRYLFTAEISSTAGLGRVYDDACDEGLTLVSARTGTEMVFVVEFVSRDAEGDILFWYLRPVSNSTRNRSLRIKLLNN